MTVGGVPGDATEVADITAAARSTIVVFMIVHRCHPVPLIARGQNK